MPRIWAKIKRTFPIEEIGDVVAAAQEYLMLLKSVIYECEDKFPSQTNPDDIFTINGLKARNMSIDDLEEQLGYPRGWTRDIPDNQRLRLLRQHAAPVEAGWLLRDIYNIEKGTEKD